MQKDFVQVESPEEVTWADLLIEYFGPRHFEPAIWEREILHSPNLSDATQAHIEEAIRELHWQRHSGLLDYRPGLSEIIHTMKRQAEYRSLSDAERATQSRLKRLTSAIIDSKSHDDRWEIICAAPTVEGSSQLHLWTLRQFPDFDEWLYGHKEEER